MTPTILPRLIIVSRRIFNQIMPLIFSCPYLLTARVCCKISSLSQLKELQATFLPLFFLLFFLPIQVREPAIAAQSSFIQTFPLRELLHVSRGEEDTSSSKTHSLQLPSLFILNSKPLTSRVKRRNDTLQQP